MRVSIRGVPAPEQAVRLCRELFGAGGDFFILKAQGGGEPEVPPFSDDREQWEEWFLAELESLARQEFGSYAEAMRAILDRAIRQYGVKTPSEAPAYELQHLIFEAGYAATARLVGLNIPAEVHARLKALGWVDRPVVDFPGLAYRMGKVLDALRARRPWDEVVRTAREVPLRAVDEEALRWVRTRAGLGLRPIFDQYGRLWATSRELAPLRATLERGIKEAIPVRKLVRMQDMVQRAKNIRRDAERLIRTEIAEARNTSAWVEAQKAAPGTRYFRQTARSACIGCVHLLRLPNGMPRLYTKEEIEAGDALGYNVGNWRTWHIRSGTIHPNCVCGPFTPWHDAMEDIFRDGAGEYASRLRQYGLA